MNENKKKKAKSEIWAKIGVNIHIIAFMIAIGMTMAVCILIGYKMAQ